MPCFIMRQAATHVADLDHSCDVDDCDGHGHDGGDDDGYGDELSLI